jgi:hypothetical protein
MMGPLDYIKDEVRKEAKAAIMPIVLLCLYAAIYSIAPRDRRRR